MRILYITDIYPTISQIFITREVIELEKRGVNIKIFSLYQPQENIRHALNDLVKAEILYGAELKSGKIKKALLHSFYLFTTPKKYLKLFQASRYPELPGIYYKFTQTPLLCRKITKFRPDRIHCHFGREGFLYGWLLKRLLDIPLSVTLHGSDILVDPYEGLQHVLLYVQKIICISECIKKAIINDYSIEHNKVQIVHCGIYIDDFCPATSLPSMLKILCVARLHKVKGLRYLIEACSLLQKNNIQFECNIYGEGDERASLERLIGEFDLKDKVHLRGAVENEKLPEIYAQHSLFVLPSLSEGMGLVLVEAMASGLPVVAANVGGIPEIVEDNVNGFLFTPGKPEELFKGIIKFMKLPDDEIETIRRKNREKVKRDFNIECEVGKLFNIFSEH